MGSSGKPNNVAIVPASAAIASDTNASPSAAATASAAPIPVVATKLVLIGTDPTDARITRDGVDLGSPPVGLQVPEGQTSNITVTRLGFVSQTLSIDSSSPKQLVKLAPNVKAASTHSHPKSGSNPGTQTQAPIDGFSDPFLNPKH